MNRSNKGIMRTLAWTVGALLLSLTIAPPALPQKAETTQTAGVDDSRMGSYRSLAELAFSALERGDRGSAARLARILERTWDRAEEQGGGEHALFNINRSLFEEIDKAMDSFIKPMLYSKANQPTASAVRSAYGDYLQKLKRAD